MPEDEAIILGRGKSVKNYYTNKTYIKNIKHIFVVNFRDNDVPKGYLKKLNNKINNRVIGIWGIFIIVVCLLIPGFEILSDFVRCGWLKC